MVIESELIGHADYAVQVDEAANSVTYIGKAEPGSLTSEAVWQIQKIDEAGGSNPELVVTWASGNNNFDKEWDERTNYTYS